MTQPSYVHEPASSSTAPVTSTHQATSAPDLDAAGATHIGHKRHENQDAFFIASLHNALVLHQASEGLNRTGVNLGKRSGTLLALADGMGGTGDGALASRLSLEAVANYMLNVASLEPNPVSAPDSMGDSRISIPKVREHLTRAFVEGERSLAEEVAQANVSQRMGTTLTVAFICWPTMYICHVGDSRAYLLRRGQLMQLTTDHTLAEQLNAQLTDRSQRIPDDSPLHHILWNAIGGGIEASKPDLFKTSLEESDRVMLCSDGLSNQVDDATLTRSLAQPEPAATIASKLVNLANASGGIDNVTVVVARFGEELNLPSS